MREARMLSEVLDECDFCHKPCADHVTEGDGRTSCIECVSTEADGYRDEVERLRAALSFIATGEGLGDGCGDGSCVVRRPRGMQTNGGCQCSERTIRLTVQQARQIAKKALEEVDRG